MIIALQKAFKDIIYIDEKHQYFNKVTGKELIPTTTFKKDFQNQFENKEYWLGKKAEEEGILPEEMQDDWTCKKLVGTKRGAIIHDWSEHLSHRREMTLSLDMTGMSLLKRQVKQYFKDHPDDYTIATEFVIGDDVRGGQIDKLVERNGEIGIVDYKTDSKTEEQLNANYGKYMKKHLSHLPDTILNGYYVQVNLYRQMLENAGFKIDFMEIIHFCIYNKQYKKYIVPKFDVIV